MFSKIFMRQNYKKSRHKLHRLSKLIKSDCCEKMFAMVSRSRH